MSDTTPQPEPTDVLADLLEQELRRLGQDWQPITGDTLASVVRQAWQAGLIHRTDLDLGADGTCELCGQGISPDTDRLTNDAGTWHQACVDQYHEHYQRIMLAKTTIPLPPMSKEEVERLFGTRSDAYERDDPKHPDYLDRID